MKRIKRLVNDLYNDNIDISASTLRKFAREGRVKAVKNASFDEGGCVYFKGQVVCWMIEEQSLKNYLQGCKKRKVGNITKYRCAGLKARKPSDIVVPTIQEPALLQIVDDSDIKYAILDRGKVNEMSDEFYVNLGKPVPAKGKSSYSLDSLQKSNRRLVAFCHLLKNTDVLKTCLEKLGVNWSADTVDIMRYVFTQKSEEEKEAVEKKETIANKEAVENNSFSIGKVIAAFKGQKMVAGPTFLSQERFERNAFEEFARMIADVARDDKLQHIKENHPRYLEEMLVEQGGELAGLMRRSYTAKRPVPVHEKIEKWHSLTVKRILRNTPKEMEKAVEDGVIPKSNTEKDILTLSESKLDDDMKQKIIENMVDFGVTERDILGTPIPKKLFTLISSDVKRCETLKKDVFSDPSFQKNLFDLANAYKEKLGLISHEYNWYEEKQRERANRYYELSNKAAKKSSSYYESGKEMASIIPFGQPILVGHHSEKRDRNYRSKISNKFDKSVEEQKKSDYYESKAKSVEANTSISSDDPEALRKLEEKLMMLKEKHTLMVDFNKAMRKKFPVETLVSMFDGRLTKKNIEMLSVKDDFGEVGFPKYKLSNSNQNIKSVENRILALKRLDKIQDQKVEYDWGDYIIDTDKNRIIFDFNSKPDVETIKLLKRNSFKWSRYDGVWQRKITDNALYAAQELLKVVFGGDIDMEKAVEEGILPPTNVSDAFKIFTRKKRRDYVSGDKPEDISLFLLHPEATPSDYFLKNINSMVDYVYGSLLQVRDNEGLQNEPSATRRKVKNEVKEDAIKIVDFFIAGNKNKIEGILKSY